MSERTKYIVQANTAFQTVAGGLHQLWPSHITAANFKWINDMGSKPNKSGMIVIGILVFSGTAKTIIDFMSGGLANALNTGALLLLLMGAVIVITYIFKMTKNSVRGVVKNEISTVAKLVSGFTDGEINDLHHDYKLMKRGYFVDIPAEVWPDDYRLFYDIVDIEFNKRNKTNEK
ncbi:MAG: hypothetical protein V7735_21435 [Photobacterium frigidiphilum]|uniref:hypothetical protein n=1 Tax=Photobacterium frigidiphilum TaxID=264736 RepID=UPI003000FD1F